MKKFKSAVLILVSLVMLFSFTVVSFANEGLQINSDSETYLRGDVTMSGDLEIQDIVLIRSYIVGNYELNSKQILISDVNMDTEIDITDIILIRAHIVGDTQIKETISFKDESSTSSSTSTSTTTKPVYDNEPISVLLEAEEAASNGEVYEGNDSAASSGKYAILTKDSGLTFTLPENATTGYYDIIIIAKDDDGEFTADILTDSTLIDTLTIGSDYWNTYVYNEIVIQTGEKLTIHSNDDGVQIDCVLISSKNSTIPSSSTTSTSASTTSTTKSSTSNSTTTTSNSTTSTSNSTTSTSKSTTSTSKSTTSTSKSTTSTSKSTTTTSTSKSTTTTTKPAQSVADGFYVSGTKLYDANGKEFIMRGVNVAHNWFSGSTGSSLQAISQLGANTVRIVLSNGKTTINNETWSKNEYNNVKSVITLCKAYKLVAVLEVHNATGSNSTTDLDYCVDYWKEMKSLVNENQKYVIVNIANEWCGAWSGSTWKSGYISAVKSMRNAGIKNTIMIDSPGWGQDGESMINNANAVFNADVNKNTMFSIHMYGTAGGSSSKIEQLIDGTLNKGVCLCIGEFGNYHSDGDVDEGYIMKYCTKKGVGYLGWSWKGNSSDLSYLDISNNWGGGSLTTWGKTLFNDTYGITNTSKVCTVYQ